MIVHQPHRLHMRIADRRSHKGEAPASKIHAHRIRLLRTRRNLTHAPPTVRLWPVADEPPHVFVESSNFLLDGKERPRVPYRGGNLETVPYDPDVGQESSQVLGTVTRNPLRVEPVKRRAVVF